MPYFTEEVRQQIRSRPEHQQALAARLTGAIGHGPGTELVAILRKLGAPECDRCKEYAQQMNRWGVEGCKALRQEIIDHLEVERRQLSFFQQMLAAGLAIRHGLPLTIPGLVDEAISQAQRSAAAMPQSFPAGSCGGCGR